MKRTREEEWSGPCRLPTVHHGGDEYFVDVRLRQFRTATPSHRRIEFITFESERGREMLKECVLLECPGCGQAIVVSRHSSASEAKCTRCGARLSLP